MVWDCCILLCDLDWKEVFRFLDRTYSWLSYAIDWCRRVQNSMSLFQKFSIDQDGLNYLEMVHWSRALHNRLRSSGKHEPLIDVMTIIPQSIYRARDLIKAKLHCPFSPGESLEIAGVMPCLVQWFYNSSVSIYLFIYFSFRVAVVSKSFEGQTDRTEEWYGTQYKQEAITDEAIKVRHIWFSLNILI